MKVALLTDSDVFAGTERHILDLAAALRAEGVEVEVAGPSRGILAERARRAGIPVLPIEKGSGLDLAAVRDLAGRLKSGHLDLIHSHNGRTILIAALAAAWARRGSTVATQHFTSPARLTRSGLKGWLGRAVHRTVARCTGRIVAISDVVRRGIIEREETCPDKVTMVWNGIADPEACPLRPAAEVRARFQIAADAPLIVSAARLEPEKAVSVLVEAVAQLLPDHPTVHCLVAGEGRQRAELQARLERLGLGHSFRLIGYQPDVLSIVRAADLFVLPSPDEPFGLALVEAMALGRPVIASSAGGPVEIVREGESGLLVPPNDAAALAGAISKVLSERDFAAGLGLRARQRFQNCFTAQRMAREMIAVYRAALLPPP